MFKTPNLLLLIVFQVCSIPIGRFNRCVPEGHLESRQPQYTYICDKPEIIIAVGLNQIVPCSWLWGVTALFPSHFTGHWRKIPGVQCHGIWTHENIQPQHTVTSPCGKAAVCFGTLHWHEQQFTGENRDMLVGDSAGKVMTERCRNPREGLMRWLSWCSLFPRSCSCVRRCKVTKSLAVIGSILVLITSDCIAFDRIRGVCNRPAIKSDFDLSSFRQ